MGRTKDGCVALSKITDEHVQKLLSLIETPKDNHERLSGKYDWLCDCVASYHMTENSSLLTNIREIALVPMRMPNGVVTFANGRGSVKLNKKLVVYDVLLMPSLNCNLILIA